MPDDVIVAEGCFLEQCSVENSIVGIRTVIQPGATIHRSARQQNCKSVLHRDFTQMPNRKYGVTASILGQHPTNREC